MLAFGRVEPDEHIWDLVFYVRTLPKVSAGGRSTEASIEETTKR
jgi:hypothetical protein